MKSFIFVTCISSDWMKLYFKLLQFKLKSGPVIVVSYGPILSWCCIHVPVICMYDLVTGLLMVQWIVITAFHITPEHGAEQLQIFHGWTCECSYGKWSHFTLHLVQLWNHSTLHLMQLWKVKSFCTSFIPERFSSRLIWVIV